MHLSINTAHPVEWIYTEACLRQRLYSWRSDFRLEVGDGWVGRFVPSFHSIAVEGGGGEGRSTRQRGRYGVPLLILLVGVRMYSWQSRHVSQVIRTVTLGLLLLPWWIGLHVYRGHSRELRWEEGGASREFQAIYFYSLSSRTWSSQPQMYFARSSRFFFIVRIVGSLIGPYTALYADICFNYCNKGPT